MRMTLVYARIADRTVADEYFAVADKVDQLYTSSLPADAEGPNMRRLREQHRRMLGNGWCERPAKMDCHYETICETCTYFATDSTSIPVLIRQRDHAADAPPTRPSQALPTPHRQHRHRRLNHDETMLQPLTRLPA